MKFAIVLAIVGVNRPNGAVHNEFISVRISDAKMGGVKCLGAISPDALIH